MNIPENLKYTRSHEWLQLLDDGAARMGITDFAQGEMGVLVFIDLPQEGDEAVKLWVRLALDARCARWRYSAHSGDYGNELAALLGRSGDAGIRESLLKRTITETLLVCPYITGVEGLSLIHI